MLSTQAKPNQLMPWSCISVFTYLWKRNPPQGESHELLELKKTDTGARGQGYKHTDLLAVDWFGAEARHRRRPPVLHRRARPRRPHRHIAHARHLPSSATRLCEFEQKQTHQPTLLVTSRQGFAKSISGERGIELTCSAAGWTSTRKALRRRFFAGRGGGGEGRSRRRGCTRKRGRQTLNFCSFLP